MSYNGKLLLEWMIRGYPGTPIFGNIHVVHSISLPLRTLASLHPSDHDGSNNLKPLHSESMTNGLQRKREVELQVFFCDSS